MTLESTIQARTLRALHRAGVYAIRMNAGKARGFKGGFVQLAPKGTPDILCWHPFGWIEIKPDKPHHDKDTIEAQRKFRIICQVLRVPHIQTDNPKEAVSYILSHGWKSGHMPV